MNSVRMGLFLAGLVMQSGLAVAAPPAGRLLASQCAQCHGTDGNAVGGMERLAGKGDLYGELVEMGMENKPGDIMHAQALGYSDAEIRLIADYLAAQQSNSSSRTPAGERAGKKRKGDDDGERAHHAVTTKKTERKD